MGWRPEACRPIFRLPPVVTHGWYSGTNCLQNTLYLFFIFWKLGEWCPFLTYFWDDPHICISNVYASNVAGLIYCVKLNEVWLTYLLLVAPSVSIQLRLLLPHPSSFSYTLNLLLCYPHFFLQISLYVILCCLLSLWPVRCARCLFCNADITSYHSVSKQVFLSSFPAPALVFSFHNSLLAIMSGQ